MDSKLTEAEREALSIYDNGSYTCRCATDSCPVVPCPNDRLGLIEAVEEIVAARPPHHELADVHAYVVPISPKMLLETLCVTEWALNEIERRRPGYNAGGTIDVHLARIRHLMDECERKRPTGPGGKHGNLHTSECGCS